MRKSLPVLVLTAALTGCSGSGDHAAAPSGTAAGSPRPTTTAQGPPTASAVPSGAFLAPADLGPGWASAPAVSPPCPAMFASTASRSTGLAEHRGTLTQTVATGVDVTAAVASWRAALGRCGFAVRDDSLGDAAVSAVSSDGADAVLVTGTEGVLVVLHAHGDLARSTDELESWADLALGTSCVAAPDGCH